MNSDSVNGVELDIPYVLPDQSYRQGSDITEAQLKQFEEEGYFLVKKLVTEEAIQEYTDHFLKISRGEVQTDVKIVKDVVLAKRMKAEGRTALKGELEMMKVQDYENDEIFMKYPKDPKILQYVKPIVGSNIRSIHTMLINKPPDLGKGTSVHPMHQDLLYFPFRPCNRIVASWTALQEINEENGCLSVIPGTHKLGMFAHRQPLEEGNTAYVGVNQEIISTLLNHPSKMYKKIALHMDPGDTVFFHPCLIHGSGPNFSNRFRKAISCHFASGLCKFIDIPKHSFELVDEMLITGTKPLGPEVNEAIRKLSQEQRLVLYKQYFRNKSRQLEGEAHDEWTPGTESVAELQRLIESKIRA